MSYANYMATTMGQVTLAGELRLAVMRLARRVRNQGGDHMLTANQTAVLATLAHRGPMTPGELAESESVRPPSMTRTLGGLEELGMVARSVHPSDGRQHLVAITDTARGLLDEDRRRREAWMVKRVAALSKEERAVLRAAVPVLERLGQS
jgi:DNA-binding MarR family transcriptional regulator